jgi:hypothetical protein
MQKTLTTLVAATVFGVSTQAHAVSPAEASIDWSNFTITLFDLNPLDGIAPSLTWNVQTTDVRTEHPPLVSDSDSANGWTTPISAVSNPANASADSNTLSAWIGSGSGYGNAYARRHGGFTLSANTLVLFSAPARAATSTVGNFAIASLVTSGVGANGTGSQSTYSDLYANHLPSSDSGILTTSFINLTGGNLDGGIDADASVSGSAPVPEPETYAMMMAGLALVGGMARRRKA